MHRRWMNACSTEARGPWSAVSKAESTGRVGFSKDRASSDNLVQVPILRLDLSSLGTGTLVFLTRISRCKSGDEVPTSNRQPSCVFLNLCRLQTKTFADDQHHTSANSLPICVARRRFHDIANLWVSCTFDVLGLFSVNHDWTSLDNHLNFFG